MRTWDAVKISQAIKHFLKTEEKVDVIEWLSNPDNIVLENDRGDLAVFEYGFPTRKIYSGHYFFKSRGRQALVAAREFLDEIFNSCYNINVMIGMVPTEHLGARWLTRQVGFTSHGYENVHDKEYELFILTKEEFNK